jgi:recombination protein RecT
MSKQEARETKVVKQEESVSTRFMNMVVKEFTGSVGEVALTNFQRRLAQNYFIAVDQALAKAEMKRKLKKDKDSLPVTWANVDLQQLALDVVAAARVGLDPAQPNHISPVPYKDNSRGKYVVVFIDGYRGIELKARKYGLDIPDSVTVELVYSNDHFKPIKKDANNKVESYEFEVNNPFDRGDLVGGFYYHGYNENPTKNKLVIFTLKDILKRRPEYASTEFWGGKKAIWKDGKRIGEEEVEGWFEKMCWKTIYRAAFRDITIDSQKIDDDYLRLRKQEELFADQEMDAEIEDNANQDYIDVEAREVELELEPEEPETGQKQAKNTKKQAENEQKQQKDDSGQQSMGPGF